MNIPPYASAITHLAGLLKRDSLAHTYLFSGPDARGKLAAAVALARSLERHEPFGSSWDFVWNDKEFWKQGGANYLFVDALVLANESLGIDEARAIRDFLITRPLLSDRRTVIIPSAHKLTMSAQQALLKITEDVPEYGLIICISPGKETLLETLASRCANVYFKNSSKVQDFGVMKDADAIFSLAGGLPGTYMALLNVPEERKRVRALATAVESGSIADCIALCESVQADDDIDRFFEGLIRRIGAKKPDNAPARATGVLEYRIACARLGTSIRTQLEAAVLMAFKG